jgi:hypothetical protein
MKTLRLAPHTIAAAVLLTVALQARADAFYTSVGLPGLSVGYAKPLSSSVTLRGDLASLPSIGRDAIEEGVSYAGSIKSDRGAVFMDWHFAGGMRMTGGLTFNHMRADLRAGGSGGAVNSGDNSYASSANDRLDVAFRFPGTTPYLGLGYSRYDNSGSSFLLDVGGSIGRPSLSETRRGPNLGDMSQADLDRELAQLRDGIARVRFMPQVSLGMSLKF